jgi:hypothetical protein
LRPGLSSSDEVVRHEVLTALGFCRSGVLALRGYSGSSQGGALDKIESLVSAHHELATWRGVVDGGRRYMMLITAIRAYLSSNPGAIQSELGRTLGRDGRQASRLVSYMDQAGQVRRDKSGRSYALLLSSNS